MGVFFLSIILKLDIFSYYIKLFKMKKLMSIFSVTLFICIITLSSCEGSNSTNDA